jgi:glutamate synthase domain-containing protein 3
MAGITKIDAEKIYYKDLNFQIKELVRKKGIKKIEIENMRGQRFLGTGLQENDVEITVVSGVPGNDLAMFMDGPTIRIMGNAQDGIGNTMNNGKVVIHGDAGDVIAYGMRNGKILIKGNVGYRVGIHMKEYMEMRPKLVVGGCAGDFFGEYMAGGIAVVMGLNRKNDQPIVGNLCATGMHGGRIYLRGFVDPKLLGKKLKTSSLDPDDQGIIDELVKEFCAEFPEYQFNEIMKEKFTKITPESKRPFGNMYSPGNFFPRPIENYISSAPKDREEYYY